MAKTIVAILGLLLVLVGPAAAQDPAPPDDGAAPEPQPDPDPASSDNRTKPSPPQEDAGCRVAATHLLDPNISPTRWVIPDPDGCFRVLIERVLGPPASFVLRRLP